MKELDLTRIKQIATRQGITMTYIAEQIGMTPTGLSRLMRENSSKAATLQKICDTIKCDISDLYADAPLPPVDGRPQEPAADPELTAEMFATLREQLAIKDAQINGLIQALNK